MIWPLLRTPRWQGFTAVVIVAIVAFGLLSAWQWSRAEERSSEERQLSEVIAADPVPLADALNEQARSDWLPVTGTGYYLSESAFVRKRPLQSRNGFWVMSPLQTSAGVLWVNRGWIPASADALATPEAPPPPAGDVSVTGYLRPFVPDDPGRAEGLPARQVSDPDRSQLPPVDSLAAGYLQLRESVPAEQEVLPVPVPEVDGTRNLSYAVQWALFALVAVAGWFFFLRREAKEDAAPAEPTGLGDDSDVQGRQTWTSA